MNNAAPCLKNNIERTLGRAVTDEDFEFIRGLMYEKSFDRKTILQEVGDVARHVYFIEKGSAYSYYENKKGEKVVMQFALEGYWISDLFSIFTGKKGIYRVETLEPVSALILNRERYEQALEHPTFNTFFRILIQNAFVALQYRLARTNSEEADARYAEFEEKYPEFIQRIPQYLIASYLGIRPQSLSRIRNSRMK